MFDNPAWHTFALSIAAFFILLYPLMFVHELGHYLAARAVGAHVLEFGIGLPPRLFGFEYNGTNFTINLIPIGAFVYLAEDDKASTRAAPSEAQGEHKNARPRTFHTKRVLRGLKSLSIRQRVLVFVSGCLANIIFGILVIWLSYTFFATTPASYHLRVLSVQPNSPANAIGLQAGDKLISFNRHSLEISDPADIHDKGFLRALALAHAGQPIVVSVLRSNQLVQLTGTLPISLNPQAPLGIQLALEPHGTLRVPLPPDKVLSQTVNDVLVTFASLFMLPAVLFGDQHQFADVRPVSPVGVAWIGGTILAQGTPDTWFTMLRLLGVLSLSVALFNLLPVPALDGGRLLFLVIEAIRGQSLGMYEEIAHRIGLILLLLFALVAIINDLVSPPA